MVSTFDLSLRHLDAALAVLRQGSINGASATVNLSQPALTQALAKLEALLGQRLFDRQPSGASPTQAGHLFLARVERGLERIIDSGRRLRRSARLKPIAYLERLVSMGQLHALAAVEKAGSYSLAAREIGLSQPSVHRAVKELEAILGLPLVFRAGRSMRPTPAGMRLVSAIRLMAAELQAGLDELAALEQAGAGTIRIGALPLPRAGLLPEALAGFTRNHPYTAITIIEGPYSDLLAALRGGEIDMVVGALRDPAPTRDIMQRSLFEDDLFIVARSRHPLAGSSDPDPANLANYPWVIGAQGSPMRARWEALFIESALPARRIECSSILMARWLLLDGDWLALMSTDQFRIEQASGLLTPIGGPVPGSRRQIGVTIRADWLPTAAQADLLAELAAAGSKRSSGI